MNLSKESFEELKGIRRRLKPEMQLVLSNSLHGSNLKIGNRGLGIFGTIFDKNDNEHAMSFKIMCKLRMLNETMSVLEREWESNPDMAYQCAAYLCGSQTIDQLKDNVAIGEPQPMVSSIHEETSRPVSEPTPQQPEPIPDAEDVAMRYVKDLPVRDLVTNQVFRAKLMEVTDKIPLEELEQLGLARKVEVEMPAQDTDTPDFLWDNAQAIVDRHIRAYGKRYVKNFFPDVWRMRKALKNRMPSPSQS